MTLPTGPLTRAAPIVASTWDASALTFDVVLSAGTAVVRQDSRGNFDEVLDIAGATFPDRLPLLDSHRRTSLDDQLGDVTNIRREGGQLVGTARLSKHSPMAQRVAAEISDGAKPGVSIGYAVSKWAETTKAGKRTLTAAAFSLLEISLVSIPADPAATIRTAPLPTTIISETTVTVPAVQTRAALSAEVRSIATAAGLDAAWTATQLDADTIDLDAVRSAAITALQTRTAAAASVRSTHNESTLDNPDVRIRAAGEALFARTQPRHQVSEPARAYVGMSTVDLARESLRHAAVSTTGMQAASIIERALHTTSDFPLILGDGVGRTIRQGYASTPSGLKLVGRQTTARDFKSKYRLTLSDAPRLEKVNEAGEIKSGSLSEVAESYKIATYAKIFGITRQALVNDDLGAFSDLANRLGQGAAATEAQLLVDLLVANSGLGPTMSDGKTLFHADHKNKSGTGAALDLTTLGAARLAIRKQTGLTGENISIVPRYLIVPPELEMLAEQLMTTIAATKTADVNTLAGKFEIVVEPRLADAKRWYVFSDIDVAGLEYAHLEGQEGVYTEIKAGFEVDGVQIKVRTDFGAGFVDYRGTYTNAGQ